MNKNYKKSKRPNPQTGSNEALHIKRRLAEDPHSLDVLVTVPPNRMQEFHSLITGINWFQGGVTVVMDDEHVDDLYRLLGLIE